MRQKQRLPSHTICHLSPITILARKSDVFAAFLSDNVWLCLVLTVPSDSRLHSPRSFSWFRVTSGFPAVPRPAVTIRFMFPYPSQFQSVPGHFRVSPHRFYYCPAPVVLIWVKEPWVYRHASKDVLDPPRDLIEITCCL
jgi:hypothetical protein